MTKDDFQNNAEAKDQAKKEGLPGKAAAIQPRPPAPPGPRPPAPRPPSGMYIAPVATQVRVLPPLPKSDEKETTANRQGSNDDE